MTNTLAQWFAQNLGGRISAGWVIFLVSMIPILELRGGLLVASMLHVKMWQAIPICILGNIIPVPFILLLITRILEWMKNVRIFRPFALWLENHAMKKSDSIRRYEFLGLLLFVGVPLPGTGAWTGSMIAALLHIDMKKSVAAVSLGLIMATIIMCVISYGILGRVW